MGKGKKAGDRSELLTKDEMDRLINVVAGDLFFTTLYKTLRYSGRRIGEIYGTERGKEMTGGVKLKDIDFENNQMQTVILKTKKRKLQVTCNACQKTCSYKNQFCPHCGASLPTIDKSRLLFTAPLNVFIPMRPELPSILKTFIDNRKPKFKPNDFIFREYSLVYLKKKIKEHCRQASINKKFSLHGFRHYFVSQCKRAGMANEDIAKWTGHVSPSSLNTYNQLIARDIENQIRGVDL